MKQIQNTSWASPSLDAFTFVTLVGILILGLVILTFEITLTHHSDYAKMRLPTLGLLLIAGATVSLGALLFYDSAQS